MKKADLELIRRQRARLAELDSKFLACRVGADGHHWDRVAPDWEPFAGETAMAWQCTVCKAIKRADVDIVTGRYASKPRYEKPRGYDLVRNPEDRKGERLSSSYAVRSLAAEWKPTKKMKQ